MKRSIVVGGCRDIFCRKSVLKCLSFNREYSRFRSTAQTRVLCIYLESKYVNRNFAGQCRSRERSNGACRSSEKGRTIVALESERGLDGQNARRGSHDLAQHPAGRVIDQNERRGSSELREERTGPKTRERIGRRSTAEPVSDRSPAVESIPRVDNVRFFAIRGFLFTRRGKCDEPLTECVSLDEAVATRYNLRIAPEEREEESSIK